MKYFCKYFMFLFSLNFIDAAFRCDYKYSTTAKAWFKHFVIPATWFDARLRCDLEGATLASPITPKIEKEMTHIIKNFFASESEIFTGISATVSQGDFFTIEGIPLSELSITWADNEPDNKYNEENCIALNGNGDVLDKACDDTRPYICYRPEKCKNNITECGTVDPEYYLDTRTNSCYKFHRVPRNFSRAHFACSAEGGHLAVINSEIEAKVLRELFAKNPARTMVGNFWKDVAFVGYHKLYEDIDWRTLNGKSLLESGYYKFSGGEPNNTPPGENCGAIYRSGLLNDLWCDRPAPFICEKNPKIPAVCEAGAPQTTTTRPPVTTEEWSFIEVK